MLVGFAAYFAAGYGEKLSNFCRFQHKFTNTYFGSSGGYTLLSNYYYSKLNKQSPAFCWKLSNSDSVEIDIFTNDSTCQLNNPY
jgi:hypothetical protein